VIPVLVAMLVILALAGLVVLYVAYPHRGEEVPNAPWVGDALRKGVEALPTLDNQREQAAAAPTAPAVTTSAAPADAPPPPGRHAQPVVETSQRR
jgi:hypothetical protein